MKKSNPHPRRLIFPLTAYSQRSQHVHSWCGNRKCRRSGNLEQNLCPGDGL